ncbi:MAG: hypothetical protein VX913_13060 [Planctomycetota bacterium]|nr:hypothetical protein [Planctomycetota bacterium]
MAKGTFSERAGLLAFVVATAWVVCEARWFGGWLSHVPLASDLQAMAGEGPAPTALLAASLGRDPIVWRVLSAVLVALVGVRAGVCVARAWDAPAATWLLPVMLVSHPFALLASRDVPTLAILVWCLVGLLTLEVLIRRKPWLGLAMLGAATILSLVGDMENASSWPNAVGELCAPVGDPEAGVPWRRRASLAAPVLILLGIGHRRRRPGDEAPMLGGMLVLILGLGTGHVVQALGLAWILAFAAARAWPHSIDRLVVVAAALLMALSGHNTARLTDAQLGSQRQGVRTLLKRVGELPSNSEVDLVDLVIGRTILGDALSLAFPERDVRSEIDLIDPGEGRQLRVTRFGRARDEWRLEPVIRATRVSSERLSLEGPPSGAILPARRAEEEPTFSWTVPVDEDPGQGNFTFVWAGHPADAPGRTVRSLPLSPTQLSRAPRGDRVEYAWRPSVRAQDGGHRELLWEREELTRRGTTLTWTVVARPRGRLHGLLMAAPRDLTPR